MKKLTWCIAVLVPLLLSTSSLGSEIVEQGPEAQKAPEVKAEPTFSLTLNTPESDRAYKRNRLMQVMGFALLGASTAMVVAGAGMVEGSPYGPTSRIGIISVGVGLAHFIAAAFLLGFSKSVIHQKLAPVTPRDQLRIKKVSLAQPGDIFFTG